MRAPPDGFDPVAMVARANGVPPPLRLDRAHRCPECGWRHSSGQTQADRVVSWLVVGLMAALILAGLLFGGAHVP